MLLRGLSGVKKEVENMVGEGYLKPQVAIVLVILSATSTPP